MSNIITWHYFYYSWNKNCRQYRRKKLRISNNQDTIISKIPITKFQSSVKLQICLPAGQISNSNCFYFELMIIGD